MPTIAKYNAMLTASAGNFNAGFASAGKAVTRFGSIFSGVAGGMAAYDLGKAAITGAYNATVGLVSSAIDAQGALHDQAAALGVTTEALGRLQVAAKDSGVDAETLSGSLTKMEKSLYDAATKGGPAADAINRLGLDAKNLANQTPEAAFAAIADKIAGIQNPSERTAAAMAIFGKSGAQLIPILNGGAAGLAEAAKMADLYGVTVNQIDNNKVDAAGDAMGHVGLLMEGVGNQLAVGLSPFIKAASEQFLGLATDGGGIGPKISSAIEWVTESIAYASDFISLFQAGWYGLNAVVLGVAGGIVKAMDLVGEGIHYVTNLLGVTEGSYEGLGVVVDQFAQDVVDSLDKASQAVQDFSSGKNSKAVKGFFDKARADAQAAAVAEGGPTKGMLSPAASAEEDTKEADKAMKEAEAAAKRYYESTRTAAEKYADEIKKINELQKQGVLDADTAARATAAAKKTLDDANKSEKKDPAKAAEPGAPKLLQAGSSEAASFVASIQRQQGGANEQKQLVKQGATGNKLLSRIADRLTNPSGNMTIVQF